MSAHIESRIPDRDCNFEGKLYVYLYAASANYIYELARESRGIRSPSRLDVCIREGGVDSRAL